MPKTRGMYRRDIIMSSSDNFAKYFTLFSSHFTHRWRIIKRPLFSLLLLLNPIPPILSFFPLTWYWNIFVMIRIVIVYCIPHFMKGTVVFLSFLRSFWLFLFSVADCGSRGCDNCDDDDCVWSCSWAADLFLCKKRVSSEIFNFAH